MGTMRWQKELTEAETRARLSAEFERKNAVIDEELAELDGPVQVLQRNIAAKRMAQGSMLSRRSGAGPRTCVGTDAGKDLPERKSAVIAFSYRRSLRLGLNHPQYRTSPFHRIYGKLRYCRSFL